MTTSHTNTSTTGGGGGFGSKIKGAAQVIHGLGENIRGTALGTADRATDSASGVEKNTDVTAKGRAEFAEGMARMKGHAPAPQVAPAGTASPRTGPADPGTTAGTGTGAGSAAGVTDQGRQQGTGDEKTSTAGGKSGPESTGPGTTQTGREAAVGAGTVHEKKGPSEVAAGTGAAPEPKQQHQSAVSQQEGKRDDRNVPERSQSGNTGQARAQETTEDRPQKIGEQSSQQKVDEQCKAGQMGVQQEGGQQGGQVGPGEGRCEKIRFQGISMDEGGEQPSQQTAEKPRETGQAQQEGGQQGSQACTAQEGRKIRFQDFQGCGV